MNWDVVIERGMKAAHKASTFDYGCDAVPMKVVDSTLKPVARSKVEPLILKPHGSINWLYCDACRRLFSTPPEQAQTEAVARQLFRTSDWTRAGVSGHSGKATCPLCESDALGTRFATFSYRKALDFPMHSRTWQTTERLLYDAKNWVFIGYSLPGADYEFKHLLKRVQLTRTSPPNIVLVTGGTPATADATRANYQRFFGPRLKPASPRVFLEGLDDNALKGLKTLGCLGSL